MQILLRTSSQSFLTRLS